MLSLIMLILLAWLALVIFTVLLICVATLFYRVTSIRRKTPAQNISDKSRGSEDDDESLNNLAFAHEN